MSAFRILLSVALAAGLAASGAARASAAEIASGDVGWGELTPAANPTWTFQGTAGGSVLIATSEISGSVRPQIFLYAPGNPAVDPDTAVTSHEGAFTEHFVAYGPLTEGTYTIAVDEAGTASGIYGISVVVVPAGQSPSSADVDGGAIDSGSTVTGSLSLLADMDVYQFFGEAGDHVVLTASDLATGLQPEIYLYPPACPDGGYEASAVGSNPSWHRLDHDLAQTGVYTVVVRDNGSNSEGTYALSLVRIPGAATSATDGDGGAIASGATMAGSLAPRADTDVFQFDGQAGDRVVVTTAETLNGVQPEIYLYPPAGVVPSAPTPWEAADLGELNEHRLEHVLEGTGTYTIVVNDAGLNGIGSYAVALAKIPGAATSASDPDGGALASGATLTGTLIGQADTDLFQFYGEAGTRVVVTTVALTSGPQPEFRIYPPGGGAAEAGTTGALTTYRLEHTLGSTGVHTVVVNDAGLNGADGTYAIALAAIPGAATSPEDTDGGAIASAETKYGTFSGRADSDLFTFYARAGETVTITATNYSYSSVQPEVFLFPPGGGPAEATATGGVLPNRLTATLASTGLYTILTSDWQLDGQGAYQIALSKSPAALPPGLYAPFPPDASAVITAESSLRWDAVAGATGYDVYFGSDPLAPLPLVTAASVATPSLAFPGKALDTVYRWRVVAHTPGGDVQGPTWWFTFRPQGIVYSDTFTDGDADGDPDWLDAIYAVNRIRTWTVGGTKTFLSSPAYDTKAIYLGSPAPFLTGSIQTSLRVSGLGTEAPNAALFFAYDNGGKRYRYVRVSVGRLVIGQEGIFGGDRAGVKLTRVVPFAKDRTYVIKVTADSVGRVRVFRKDGAVWRALATCRFRKPMPGFTGYWTKKSRGVFDNFLLTAETILP